MFVYFACNHKNLYKKREEKKAHSVETKGLDRAGYLVGKEHHLGWFSPGETEKVP